MKQTFVKGIESLIPKKSTKTREGAKQEPIFYIEIEKIKANPYQPRKDFDQDGLRSLSDSIKEHGILQPLLVSRIEKDQGTEYQLLAGERRLLASRMVGLTQVPVIIKEPSEKEKLEVSLIENIQRLNLNAMEKAEAYKKLQDEFNFLQKDIAKLVGKSREAVANTLRLLDLPQEIKLALREERISEGHARALLALDNPQKQKDLFSKTVKEELSVREVESLVRGPVVRQPQVLPELTEKRFKKAFGLKNIKLSKLSGRPKLTILFNSRKEIEEFFKKFD